MTALADTLISFDTGSPSSTDVLCPDSPSPSTDSSENENTLEAADDTTPFNKPSTRMTWQKTWNVNPVSDSDNSDDEQPEEQEDPQEPLSTYEKPCESPWDKWSAPTVNKDAEKWFPEPSMDHPTSPKSQDAENKRGFVYLKEYVNARDVTSRDNPGDFVTSSSTSRAYSSPSSYTRTNVTSSCTYCGEQVGNDAKITIEHLNISCHPSCFKCGVCSKPMGDLIHNMFLHKGTVHCDSCYSDLL
ncbi:hypothetical protein DPEC_G00021580 [Dallia pectoralis]|uniref:Uncharacterized protein n=1 Tax=Dallia pectoralis TaxID=75939 RepID=A0ACC2HG59_DALPE|nr:hypothetical protein DPEC_G00021580 [Dallia pectoralis]